GWQDGRKALQSVTALALGALTVLPVGVVAGAALDSISAAAKVCTAAFPPHAHRRNEQQRSSAQRERQTRAQRSREACVRSADRLHAWAHRCAPVQKCSGPCDTPC